MYYISESIFDLVSEKDKEKMAAAKNQEPVEKFNPADLRSKVVTSTPEVTLSHSTVSPRIASPSIAPSPSPSSLGNVATSNQGNLIPGSHGNQPLFCGGSQGFKPFAKDADKQRRYELFLESRKKGIGKDTYFIL